MHIDLAAIHIDVNSPIRIDLNQSFLSGIALTFFESIWHRCRSFPEMLDLHRFQIDLKSAAKVRFTSRHTPEHEELVDRI
jgi:hypothetical protein